ncbi:hypothetical protein BC835DRAFT_1521118 [Cytidiella melzeri]|nr:hypothetical protein BC835DRAFT_1521118 [Cytidiella melzeri]
MPSATFEFLPGKMAGAFKYVRDCFQWLAAGGDIFKEYSKPVGSGESCTRSRTSPAGKVECSVRGAISSSSIKRSILKSFVDYTLNPHKGNLALHRLREKKGLKTTLDALPSLGMPPSIRRISTQHAEGSSIAAEFVSKKLVLQEGHAKYFS